MLFVRGFFFNDTSTTEIYTYGHTLSLHDALPISRPTTMPTWWWSTPAASSTRRWQSRWTRSARRWPGTARSSSPARSEEHTSELQSLMRISYAVFCLKKKTLAYIGIPHVHTPTTQYHLVNPLISTIHTTHQ